MQSDWPVLRNWVFAKVVESSPVSESSQTCFSASSCSPGPGHGSGLQAGYVSRAATASPSGQIPKPFSQFNFTPSAGKGAFEGGLAAVLQVAGGVLRFLGRGGSGNFGKRLRKGQKPLKQDLSIMRGPIVLMFGDEISSCGNNIMVGGRTASRAASLLLNRVTSLLVENFSKIRNRTAGPTALATMLPPFTSAPTSTRGIPLASELEKSCMMGNFDGMLRQHSKPSRRQPTDGVIVEPKTGVHFPVHLGGAVGDQDTPKQVLAGVGARAKNIIKLKSIMIYAFGLYVQPDQLRAKIGEKYAGVPPEELKYRPDFYDDLLSKGVDMTIRLVVHYKGLRMAMVRSAFESSLKSRLAKIKGAEGDKGLHDFCSLMSEDVVIFRGTTIDFRWQPGGALQTEIGGRRVGTIFSHHLCRAFFEMYIGDPAVSEPAKLAIGESFARLLTTCSRP